jgi:hypothetical protein
MLRTLAGLAVCLSTGALYAQTITGTIAGSVFDSTGLPVLGASITLSQASTGAERKSASDERGGFAFSSLQPGEYHLKVVMSGFKTLERRSLMLSASETLALGSLTLEVGATTETITVTAQGAMVQTATAERAGIITSSQVDGILIRSRNVMSLLQLLPGIVDLTETERIEPNWDFYALGNRRNTNNVALDGMTLNAVGNNFNSVVSVSMDAVSEVKVLLSNYQAEYGRMSGANIQIVTRSGSREFHGLVSYFKRHEQFNANNFFNNRTIIAGQPLPKPRYRYNTWSYNIGGPVYIPGRFNRNKDKLFFFWVQEFWPLKSTLAQRQVTVPTELERRGDFSQSLDLNNRLIVVNDPVARTPMPGNIVPANRIDANGQTLLKVFPMPNFFDRSISGGRYNYVFQPEGNNPTRTETLKLDYHLNSNNLLFFNYTHRRDTQEGTIGVPTAGAMNWEQLKKKVINDGQVFITRYQRIFSPTLINELNVGFSRRPWDDFIADEDLRRNQREGIGYKLGQFNAAGNPLGLIPNATFSDVSSAANLVIEGRTPLVSTHDIFTLTNNLTKTFTGHIFKAGFYYDRMWASNPNPVDFNGSFAFGRNVNNPIDSNYGYSNAIFGVFNSYSESSARPPARSRQTNLEWFVQDNWKVASRLTLDFGLRFAIIFPPTAADNNMSGFALERFDPAKAVKLIQPAIVDGRRVGRHPVTGQTYPAAFIGAIAPGTGDLDNGTVVPAKDPSYPATLVENRGVHLQPRLGFSWDPFGRHKTAVRGGFGMFHNRMAQGMVQTPFTAQPPLVRLPVINFGTMATLLSSTGFLFPTNGLMLDRTGKVPTTMNYSFSIQQDVGFGTVVDIGYVGSTGRHLLWQRNLGAIPFGANFNPANIDPTTGAPLAPAFLRPYQGYNDVNVREGASSSNYHSLQVSANRRFAKGLQAGVAWTWSKAMDYNSGDADSVSVLLPVRVWNYGLASFDRTHVLKINWLWETPRARWGNAATRQITDSWQISGVASFVSGAPAGVGFGTTVGMDITGSPTDGARVFVTGNPVLPKGERTFSRNFRTEVFRLPAVGTVGNSARTLLRGPGINNWDIAVIKSFMIREPFKLQLRWESYNAFNHTQFAAFDTAARFDPQSNQVNARFGEFTVARSARIMQFALRLNF